MTNKLITMENIQKIFSSEDIETHALSKINFSISAGEYIAITGQSGCGKSTLLSILGLLDNATAGDYLLNGINAEKLTKVERAQFRNQHIGFVFQSFNLISDMTVRENVELPLTYRKGLKKNELRAMAEQALQSVDMHHRADHFPAQLSGGQQQRAAIARAIVGKPSLILADEPTGNLDSSNAARIMELFDMLHAAGTTICMVTHDPIAAARTARTINLKDGQIIDDKLNRAESEPLVMAIKEA